MIVRLPLYVKIFDENDQVIQTIKSTKKSQVRLRVHGLPRTKWTYGTCRVWYSKDKDVWNEFRFENINQLDDGLVTNTEKDLITYLKSVIPAPYLEKRKLSPAQERSIREARAKSKMAGGAR